MVASFISSTKAAKEPTTNNPPQQSTATDEEEIDVEAPMIQSMERNNSNNTGENDSTYGTYKNAATILQDRMRYLAFLNPKWRETLRDVATLAEPEYERMVLATAKRNEVAKTRINNAWEQQLQILTNTIDEATKSSSNPDAETLRRIFLFNDEATKAIRLMKSPTHFITFLVQATNFVEFLSDVHIRINAAFTLNNSTTNPSHNDNDQPDQNNTDQPTERVANEPTNGESSTSQSETSEGKIRGGAAYLRKGVKRKYKVCYI